MQADEVAAVRAAIAKGLRDRAKEGYARAAVLEHTPGKLVHVRQVQADAAGLALAATMIERGEV